MKILINVFLVLLFVSTCAFSQDVIKRNECRRFIGKSTHMDFIVNENTIPAGHFDSVKFCAAVLKIYESLNLDIITGKEWMCLLGYSMYDVNEYGISIVHGNNMVYFNITNTSAPYKVYTSQEFKAIRKFQVELTERFLKEIRSYL